MKVSTLDWLFAVLVRKADLKAISVRLIEKCQVAFTELEMVDGYIQEKDRAKIFRIKLKVFLIKVIGIILK